MNTEGGIHKKEGKSTPILLLRKSETPTHLYPTQCLLQEFLTQDHLPGINLSTLHLSKFKAETKLKLVSLENVIWSK